MSGGYRFWVRLVKTPILWAARPYVRSCPIFLGGEQVARVSTVWPPIFWVGISEKGKVVCPEYRIIAGGKGQYPRLVFVRLWRVVVEIYRISTQLAPNPMRVLISPQGDSTQRVDNTVSPSPHGKRHRRPHNSTSVAAPFA